MKRLLAALRRDNPDREAEVRRFLLGLLEASEPPKDSVAYLRWQADRALHQALIAEQAGDERTTSFDELESLASGPLRDEIQDRAAQVAATGRAAGLLERVKDVPAAPPAADAATRETAPVLPVLKASDVLVAIAGTLLAVATFVAVNAGNLALSNLVWVPGPMKPGRLLATFRSANGQAMKDVRYTLAANDGRSTNGVAGSWLDVAPGTWMIDAQVQGYQPLHEPMTVERGRELRREFTLTAVPLPRTPVSVPRVLGLTEAAARNALTADGLVVGNSIVQRESRATPGTVIDQNPRPGSVVAPGTRVDLIVVSATVTVPDCRGVRGWRALEELSRIGLRLGRVEQRESSATPGTVIAQKPPAGSIVGRETSVDLAVAVTPPVKFVIVPDVTRKPQRDAAAILERAGLRFALQAQPIPKGYKEGDVISQSPAPGQRVRPGTTIRLLVATTIVQRPKS